MTDRPMDPSAQLKPPPLAFEKPGTERPEGEESYEDEIEAEETGITNEQADRDETDDADDNPPDDGPEVAYQPRSV
jgi:hypothetical protein